MIRPRSRLDAPFLVRPLFAYPDRKIARLAYAPAGRRLHIVDIENLIGGPQQGESALRAVSAAYATSAPVAADDHVIVAANPRLILAAGLVFPRARLLMGYGPDGADLALLGALDDIEWVAERYDEVIIGSGDGIFSDIAIALRRRGLVVGVLGVPGGISTRLARVAHFVRVIPGQQLQEAA